MQQAQDLAEHIGADGADFRGSRRDRRPSASNGLANSRNQSQNVFQTKRYTGGGIFVETIGLQRIGRGLRSLCWSPSSSQRDNGSLTRPDRTPASGCIPFISQNRAAFHSFVTNPR